MNTNTIIAQVAEWLGVIAVAWLLALNPRLRQMQIGFKYARRDGFVALALTFIVILFAFLFSTTGLGDLLTGPIDLPGQAAELSAPLALAVFSLLPIIAALVLRGQPLRSAGWNRPMGRAGLQVGLALVLLTVFLRNRVVDVLSGISTDETWYLLGALGIAIAEETVFRGYLQLRLNWWLGEQRGWLVVALAYAAWRLPGLLASDSLPAILIGLALALGQGLVTGWLMRKSGHVLAPALYRAVSIWMNVFV